MGTADDRPYTDPAAAAHTQATMALVVAVKDLTIAVRGLKEEEK